MDSRWTYEEREDEGGRMEERKQRKREGARGGCYGAGTGRVGAGQPERWERNSCAREAARGTEYGAGDERVGARIDCEHVGRSVRYGQVHTEDVDADEPREGVGDSA